MIPWPVSNYEHTPTARVHHSSGADLRFSRRKFDFVYSYAVFQHIPSREVVFAYLAKPAVS